jgi:hypothetical protein
MDASRGVRDNQNPLICLSPDESTSTLFQRTRLGQEIFGNVSAMCLWISFESGCSDRISNRQNGNLSMMTFSGLPNADSSQNEPEVTKRAIDFSLTMPKRQLRGFGHTSCNSTHHVEPSEKISEDNLQSRSARNVVSQRCDRPIADPHRSSMCQFSE